jgi:hypothetical protein
VVFLLASASMVSCPSELADLGRNPAADLHTSEEKRQKQCEKVGSFLILNAPRLVKRKQQNPPLVAVSAREL